MKLSQIYLTDIAAPQLPPYLEACTSSLKLSFSSLEYTLYNNQSLRDFIEINYDKDTLWAYDKLIPYAYKADLGRYCLLYKLGGWYFDISIRVMSGITLPEDIDMLIFRDIPTSSGTSWACANGLIYSKKNSAVFETAIKDVIENCRNNYYGVHSLCPTGPNLFGRALAKHGSSSAIAYGDLIPLTPNHSQKNLAFILPDGFLFALLKPTGGGDLTGVGAIGTNNYNELYSKRNIYKG